MTMHANSAMFSSDSMGSIDLRLLHVLDGSMGSSIGELGYDLKSTPAWSSGANITNPDIVIKAHTDFIDAGADIILTNTYQANIKRLSEKLGVEEATKFVTKGVELANKAVEISKKGVFVVGSIGPYATYLGNASEYNGSYMNDEKFNKELIKENYVTQAKALYDAGIRVFAFETIPSLTEAIYAKEVLESINCDGWISVICKNGSDLVNGDKFSDFVKAIVDSKHVKAVGINCTSPEYIKDLLKSGLPFLKNKGYVVYPNSGEKYDDEIKEFYGNVRIWKIIEELEDWIQLGVRITGGCCRVKNEDIRKIAEEVNKLN